MPSQTLRESSKERQKTPIPEGSTQIHLGQD